MNDLQELKEVFKEQIEWYNKKKKALEDERDKDIPIDIDSYFYDCCIYALQGMKKSQAQYLLQILSRN